jgi:glycosyltransferase involved in cell wall biosynthesis
MKIAFYASANVSWYGGVTYLKNLFYAMHYTYGETIKFHPMLWEGNTEIPHELKSVTCDAIKIPSLQRWTLPWAFGAVKKRLFPHDCSCEENLLKKHKIDAVFGLIITKKYLNIPTLTWIPDFQHRRLPEMFSREECFARDRMFHKSSEASSIIMVMSKGVKGDFEKFLPQFTNKIKILSNASYIPESIYEEDPKKITDPYNLPEKFIYVPNQFFKHKNHQTAFKAIKILKDKGVRINLVCTGSSEDYRNPAYFNELFRKVSFWNLKGQVIYLGIIPYKHVLALMRQSVSILNPSLFEGFGLTINEAKSLGKKALLSDLPVFHEQKLAKATFFNPRDVEDLAEKMTKVWQETPPGPDLKLEENARRKLPQQMEESAHSFMSAIKEATGR